MDQRILYAQRLARQTGRTLSPLRLTLAKARLDAADGCGLCISNCPPAALVGQVGNAIRNCRPEQSLVVPVDYALGEAIAEDVSSTGISMHQIQKWDEGPMPRGIDVHVAAAEKLAFLRDALGDGFRPSVVHVVDPTGSISQRYYCTAAGRRCRGDLIGDFKAVCGARGISPYIIFWTSQQCMAFFPSDLCRWLGLSGCVYADGRTLRTASMSECLFEESCPTRNETVDGVMHFPQLASDNDMVLRTAV